MHEFYWSIRDRERLTMALRDIDYVTRCCPKQANHEYNPLRQ